MIPDVFERSSQGLRPRTAAVLAVSLVLAIGSSFSLAAQTATTGLVLGKVTDPSGALVVGAEVILTDTATTQARTQRTNDAGQFTFASVMPGTYTLKVTATGVPRRRVEGRHRGSEPELHGRHHPGGG